MAVGSAPPCVSKKFLNDPRLAPLPCAALRFLSALSMRPIQPMSLLCVSVRLGSLPVLNGTDCTPCCDGCAGEVAAAAVEAPAPVAAAASGTAGTTPL